jgi:hypothetical protein
MLPQILIYICMGFNGNFVVSIFIGIIFGMNVGMIDGIGLLCRRGSYP